MANSGDLDQTAPSGPALFAYVILSDTLVFEIFGHLPYTRHVKDTSLGVSWIYQILEY